MNPIYGILLAAGASTRMGRPKQLLPWAGQPLVRHLAEQALASQLAGLIVVLGASSEVVQPLLADLPRMTIVTNAAYQSGQASSLRCGVAALPADAVAALVLLVDQPLIAQPLLDQLIAAYHAEPSAALVPTYQGQRGNPVMLGRELFPALSELTGDQGARPLLANYAAHIREIALEDPAVIRDADTPTAWADLTADTISLSHKS